MIEFLFFLAVLILISIFYQVLDRRDARKNKEIDETTEIHNVEDLHGKG